VEHEVRRTIGDYCRAILKRSIAVHRSWAWDLLQKVQGIECIGDTHEFVLCLEGQMHSNEGKRVLIETDPDLHCPEA